MINRIGGLLACSLVSGCSSVAWTKPDTDSAVARQDSTECLQLADSEAWRQRWERHWPPTFYDGRYMPPYYRWPRPFWYGYPASVELEQDLYDFCMHSKGYRRTAPIA